MQLPGHGAFGPPRSRQDALDVLRYAVRAGVSHIDTAQFYGPDVANDLICEALYPYPGELVLVSKVGPVATTREVYEVRRVPSNCVRALVIVRRARRRG